MQSDEEKAAPTLPHVKSAGRYLCRLTELRLPGGTPSVQHHRGRLRFCREICYNEDTDLKKRGAAAAAPMEDTRMEHKREKFLDALQDCPVIAALKSDEGLEKAIASDCTTVFFLYGTILDIASHVERVKQAGKIVFVHADLIEGLTARDITADFIAQNTRADGIISTRPNIIRRAKALGMLTIQRFFLFDSLSFENVLRQSSNADAVDLLPATMPRVLERLSHQIRLPIIASGLLADKQDVVAALSAGVQAVSTTSPALWDI